MLSMTRLSLIESSITSNSPISKPKQRKLIDFFTIKIQQSFFLLYPIFIRFDIILLPLLRADILSTLYFGYDIIINTDVFDVIASNVDLLNTVKDRSFLWIDS